MSTAPIDSGKIALAAAIRHGNKEFSMQTAVSNTCFNYTVCSLGFVNDVVLINPGRVKRAYAAVRQNAGGKKALVNSDGFVNGTNMAIKVIKLIQQALIQAK